MHDFTVKIDELLRKKSLLNHPFYQLWQQGKLSRQALQSYATEYYHLEAAFPTFLLKTSLHADEDVTDVIMNNYNDETVNGKSHAELWLDFTQALGMVKSAIKKTIPLESTKRVLDKFTTKTSANLLQAISSLLAYEANLQETSATKVHGLQQFYGITDENSTQFFTLHSSLDIKHSNDWKGILTTFASTEEDQQLVLATISESMDVLWQFLDGIMVSHPVAQCA